MTLPTEKSKRQVDLQHTTMLVYAPPKTGKTTFASTFPKAIFAATEPGHKAVEVYKSDINSWEDFLEFCVDLKENDGKDFSTVVIDTVDVLFKQCQEFICKREDIVHVGDLGFGKGWSFLSDEFMNTITKLARLPYGLLLISHSKEVEMKGRVMTYSKTVPTFNETARKVMLPLVDIILYMGIETIDEKDNRVLYCHPKQDMEAGDRYGILPDKIILPQDPQDDFKTLNKYFK